MRSFSNIYNTREGAASWALPLPLAFKSVAVRVLVLIALATALFLVLPVSQAQAATATDTAYSRSVTALKNYSHAKGYSSALKAVYGTNSAGRTVIDVSVGDLGLSSAKKQQVMDRVYYNTSYWWVDGCGDGKWTTTAIDGTKGTFLRYTCIFSNSSIDSYKKKMEARVSTAFNSIRGCSSSFAKVHMLHDWVIKNIDYVSNAKMNELSAAGVYYRYKQSVALALGYADCSGYAMIMDYLLRQAGFTTAFAYNAKADHIWNMVHIGSKWYHVDVTWAHTYTGRYFWKDCICHRWLLLSDDSMDMDEHAGWVVLKNGVKANYKAAGSKYDYYGVEDWNKGCAKTTKAGKTFTVGKLTYKVTSTNAKVKVYTAANKRSSSYSVPSYVWYKGHGFEVTSIGSKAFKNCSKATSLTVGSHVKAVGSRAFQGCSKLKTLTLKTSLLTKKGVKSSLSGSSVKKLKLSGSAKKKRTVYKTYFAKGNSGRSVKL